MLTKILEGIKEAAKAFAIWVGLLRESVNGSYKIRNRWLTTFVIIGLIALNLIQCDDNKKKCTEIQTKCDRNDSLKQVEIDKLKEENNNFKIQQYKYYEELKAGYERLLDEKLNGK